MMMSEALRWASAAGAVAVTRLGALPSLPTTEEVEALLREAYKE
jgi:sugar/nucleoside kinase (ribokinase family)